jgi:hypothetical protein
MRTPQVALDDSAGPDALKDHAPLTQSARQQLSRLDRRHEDRDAWAAIVHPFRDAFDAGDSLDPCLRLPQRTYEIHSSS